MNLLNKPRLLSSEEVTCLAFLTISVLLFYSEFFQVTVESVLEMFKTNVEKAKQILVTAIGLLAKEDWTETLAANQVSSCFHESLFKKSILLRGRRFSQTTAT